MFSLITNPRFNHLFYLEVAKTVVFADVFFYTHRILPATPNFQDPCRSNDMLHLQKGEMTHTHNTHFILGNLFFKVLNKQNLHAEGDISARKCHGGATQFWTHPFQIANFGFLHRRFI